MKKVFALLLVLALALSTAAFADEAIGSPVPMEVTNVTPEGVTATVTAAEADELVSKLAEAIANEGDNEKVFASAGLENLAKYELVELVGLEIENYDPAKEEDVVLTIKFASAFAQGDDLITLLGLIDGTDVTWENVAFAVEENGSLTVTLTSEQAVKVMNGTAVIAVLKAIAE